MKKYPKIRELGDEENKDIFTSPDDEIIIQEKVDGGNIRFHIKDDGTIIFGSRNQQMTSDEGEDTNVSNNFNNCVRYVREILNKNMDKIDLNRISNYIFFGECMVKHTINYNWQEIPPFLGFDVYDLEKEKFRGYREIKELYNMLGLETVPLVDIKKAKDIEQPSDEKVPNSKYISPSEEDQKAEGIIYKNYDKGIFAKYVRQKFREKNRYTFGSSKKHAKDDNEFFLFQYCTNSRIDKCIFKILDEGNKLGMEIMGDLVNRVYKDIWEENWQEIAFSKRTIDTNTFKKSVSKRCLEVLKQMITNNQINQGDKK